MSEAFAIFVRILRQKEGNMKQYASSQNRNLAIVKKSILVGGIMVMGFLYMMFSIAGM